MPSHDIQESGLMSLISSTIKRYEVITVIYTINDRDNRDITVIYIIQPRMLHYKFIHINMFDQENA